MQNFILLIFIYLFISLLKAEHSIVLQSTTSLKNSGFYDYILPLIYKDLGIPVFLPIDEGLDGILEILESKFYEN